MNTQTRSKIIKKRIRFFPELLFSIILFAVLVLSSCSTINNKMQANYWEDRNRRLQSRLPEGMSFEEVPLSTVLEEISKESGLVIKPWKDEGDRKVTIDVSGMTVDEALKAVVLYVDGEGAVLIRQKYFLHYSWGQDWLWGYPPTR
jgi:hypothetical protein